MVVRMVIHMYEHHYRDVDLPIVYYLYRFVDHDVDNVYHVYQLIYVQQIPRYLCYARICTQDTKYEIAAYSL